MFESKIFRIFHASKRQKTEGTKQSRTETKEVMKTLIKPLKYDQL